MNHTSRMVALLGELRRERNGMVADALCVYGTPYGLNYGVSLPTIRQIARAEAPDYDFARYLFRQDVRELRLAALHIAPPEHLVPADFAEWASGMVNSELAAEAAFALLHKIPAFPELFRAWTADAEPLLLHYAALMAAARFDRPDRAWAEVAAHQVHAAAMQAPAAVAHLVAEGAVALLAALAAENETCRQAVLDAVGTLGTLPAENFVREELAWRLL